MPDDGSTTATTEGAPEGQQSQQERDMAALPEWARDSLSKANAEAAKYRTRVRELEPKASEYDKLAEAQKTEQQKAAEARQAAETRAVQAEQEATRLRVALTKGLPADLATRLVGGTEDELAADADRLLELVKVAPQTPSFDGGTRQTASTTDMNSMIRRAAGRQ
jgi:hypothetical protein